jgi:hypothetical protein
LLDDNPPVVESEIQAFDLVFREPSGLRRVVASFRPSGDRRSGVEDGHVVSARIAVGVRVDAEKLAHPHPEPGLLEGLARAALLRALSPLEKAARQAPFPLEWRTAPAD